MPALQKIRHILKFVVVGLEMELSVLEISELYVTKMSEIEKKSYPPMFLASGSQVL